MKYAILNRRINKCEDTGGGWTDIPFLTKWFEDPMKAQEMADALTTAQANFDREKLQTITPNCVVVDENGEEFTPPPWNGHKFFPERVGYERRKRKAV